MKPRKKKKKKTLKNNKKRLLLTKLFLFQWISIHWLPFSLAAHQLRTCEVGWNLEFTKFFFLPSSDEPVTLDSSRAWDFLWACYLSPCRQISKHHPSLWRSGPRDLALVATLVEGCQKSSLPTLEKVALIPLKCQTLKRLVPVTMQHPHSWWINCAIDFITQDYRHQSQPQESWEFGPFMSFLIESRTINS